MRTFFLTLLLIVPRLLSAQDEGISVGQSAPLFSLPYATRDSIARTPLHLSDLLGKANIVLAFYPADWSPGCTQEICTLRDNVGGLDSLNAEILGISGDYTWSHHAWAKELDLPFKLLSDHSHDVARKYQSYNELTGFNKRTVFVIDKQGSIAYADLEYSVRDLEDFTRLRRALAELP